MAANVAVREHDAFGLAGGARSVDEGGQILGLDGANERVEDGIALSAGDRRHRPESWTEGDGTLGSGANP